MEFDLSWKYFGIKFFTIAFALCIFTIERMHALIHMCHVLHKAFFQENPYYPVRGHQNFQ